MKITYCLRIDDLRAVAFDAVILNKTQKRIVSHQSFKHWLIKTSLSR